MGRIWRRPVLAGLMGLVAIGTLGAAAPEGRSGVLGKVAPGQWQLRETDGGASRSLCVGDAAALLQLQHPRSQCSRAVIDSDASSLTVHYTCPGAGHGRTTLTLRTGASLRIHTQGIAAGAPFEQDFDARRVGDCAAALTGQ